MKMSSPPKKGRPGGRKTSDRVESPPSNDLQRQKGREAARKHRQKKLNELKSLEERNKQIKQQNNRFKQKLSELQELNALAVKLLQEHRDAGCCLPEDINDCSSLTHHLHDNDISLEQSNHSSQVLGSPAEEDQSCESPIECEVYTVSTNPKALFSGETLPDVVRSPPRPQQASSANFRQAVATKKFDENQTSPSSQGTISPVPLDVNQTKAQLSQGKHISTSPVHVSGQSQESNAAGAVQRSIQSSQHSSNQIWKYGFLEMDGQLCKVIYNDKGQIRRVSEQSETNNHASSTFLQNGRSTSSAQFYQADGLDQVSHELISTGNIPSTGLCGDFQLTMHAPMTAGHRHLDSSSNTGNTPLKDNGQSQIHPAQATADSSFSQQGLSIPPIFAFTDNLEMYGIQPHVRYQMESETQEDNEAIPANTFSPPTLENCHTGELEIFTQSRISNNTAPTSIPYLGEKTQNPGTSSSFDNTFSSYDNSTIVCAPAMLDMISNSELSSSLQNTLKASLASGGFSNLQTRSTVNKNLIAQIQQRAHTSGELSNLMLESVSDGGHASISSIDSDSGLKLQDQSKMSSTYQSLELVDDSFNIDFLDSPDE
ncbi:hypothetical protein EGW08_011163, partial [Elysia chlorotica]